MNLYVLIGIFFALGIMFMFIGYLLGITSPKKAIGGHAKGLLIIDHGNPNVNHGVYFQAFEDPMGFKNKEKILLEVMVMDDSQGKQTA